MKERLLTFVKIYVLFVCLFVVQKPLFMLFYADMFADAPWTDWFAVMGHGLPLDLSVAGYLTALPGLLLLVSAWSVGRWLRVVFQAYFALVALLVGVIFVTDLALYEYWGFRLDTTPFFYFFSSPRDAVASASGWMAALGFLSMAAWAVLVYALFYAVVVRPLKRLKVPYRRVGVSAAMLLLTGVLFLPIRGGFTVSTMNTGKVYFSTNQRLNHAAINPAFSLLESISKQTDFAAQYRFLQPADADRVFATLLDPQARTYPASAPARPAGERALLNTSRPDVLLIILESFSSHLMATLGGDGEVAPCLDSLATEGVLFTHFYANSFRTDRGLVSVLSGYPAQPSTSIMKYPRKTQSIPAIAGALREAGYRTRYYYGGDADFTNMRSYLMSSGFEDIVCDRDFPVSQRLSKWGVHDHLVFRRLLDDLRADTVSVSAPLFHVLQTSSSHEPFEVPYRRLEEDRRNAFAYADSCVGDFVRQLRRMPRWENTLLVFVPDHQGAWPEGLNNFSEERYRIPLIFAGGAVSRPCRIDAYGSQHDLAATLLAQLGLPHGQFTFSKDLLDPRAPHFAFITYPGMMGLLTDTSFAIYDLDAEKPVAMQGVQPERTLTEAKAYLQKLYDDIAKR